jgi:hypothetical protein
MRSPRPRLHAPVISAPAHIAGVREQLTAIVEARAQSFLRGAATGSSFQIRLSTISRANTFDAYISLRLGPPDHSVFVSLEVDSGNDTLILPCFDDLKGLPNFDHDYTILSKSIKEPFGCPAKLLRGPITIPTPSGDFIIKQCDFFACTAPNKDNRYTANFGTGWIDQWSTFTDDGNKKFVVKPPLRANDNPYRYIELDYMPDPTAIESSDDPKIADSSWMNIQNTPPTGYERMYQITRGTDALWMSLQVRSLTIGAEKTKWPGPKPYPMAMIDTGGGPVLLSDLDGSISTTIWPKPAPMPDWITSTSIACQAIYDPLTIELGDGNNWFSYRIDTSKLPKSVQGLTMVLCKDCSYLQGYKGINIGGISALFNYTLIDNKLGQVGFKSRHLAIT